MPPTESCFFVAVLRRSLRVPEIGRAVKEEPSKATAGTGETQTLLNVLHLRRRSPQRRARRHRQAQALTTSKRAPSSTPRLTTEPRTSEIGSAEPIVLAQSLMTNPYGIGMAMAWILASALLRIPHRR